MRTAQREPSRMVNSMPMLNSRSGSRSLLFRVVRLMWVASVKSSITRPTSAMRRKLSRSTFGWPMPETVRTSAMPPAVKRIGAVTMVRESRLEMRL